MTYPGTVALSRAHLTRLSSLIRVHRRRIGSWWRKLPPGRQALLALVHLRNATPTPGDRHEEADTLTHLGDTHHATGNPDAARDAWQQALTILDQLDHADADTVRAKLHHLDQPTTPTRH